MLMIILKKSILDAIKDNQNKNAQTTPSDSTNSDKFIKKIKGKNFHGNKIIN